MLPLSLKSPVMALHVKRKASKLALLIHARTKVPVPAKRISRFVVRLSRSMKRASTVKEAVLCLKTTADTIWVEHQYRTKRTWDFCKERVEDLWNYGALGPLAPLRHIDPFKQRTLRIYFDAVARSKTEEKYEATMKHFLELFILECVSGFAYGLNAGPAGGINVF